MEGTLKNEHLRKKNTFSTKNYGFFRIFFLIFRMKSYMQNLSSKMIIIAGLKIGISLGIVPTYVIPTMIHVKNKRKYIRAEL